MGEKKTVIPYYSLGSQQAGLKHEILAIFEQVFDSQWFILGDRVREFEKELAGYLKTTHAIGTGNGYDALKIGLLALGIGPGDEVIVPAYTFIASVSSVLHTGAVPVLTDINGSTGSIDPAKIPDRITKRTKAIMPVHLFGTPAEMDKIMKVAADHQLLVIEDFAQATGASYSGQKTGTFGQVGCTSFYPVKNLGALGDGGAIITHHAELAGFCRKMRNYGSDKKYEFEMAGFNSRLDELQAAILRVKLKYLDQWNGERKKIAHRYLKNLHRVDGIILPEFPVGSDPVFHIFPVFCPARDALKSFLEKNGIGTLIHYPVPPHLQKGLKSLGYQPGDFPVTEKMAATQLSLPVYPGLSINEIDQVCECIVDFSKKNF